MVGSDVHAHDLHVDRTRQAEIQGLAHDIGRQECKRRRRKILPERAAQPALIVGAGMMLLLQRNENIGITRADRGRRAVGRIDAAVRQPNVVDDAREFGGGDDLADVRLDRVAKCGCLLDAQPRAGAQVQLDLARVHRREEVLTEPRQIGAEGKGQNRGAHHRSKKNRRKALVVLERNLKKPVVALAHLLKSLLEAHLESLQEARRRPGRFFIVRLQPIFRQRGHEGARQQIGSEHGEDDRFGQGHEQEFRDAGQKKHGHEHDADRQCRYQRWQRDLLRSGQNRRLHRLALLKMPVDVLDRDGGIVNENADRERKPTQGHDVDGLPQRRKTGDGG